MMGSNPHDMEVDVKPILKEVDGKLDHQKVYNLSPVEELESEFEEVGDTIPRNLAEYGTVFYVWWKGSVLLYPEL